MFLGLESLWPSPPAGAPALEVLYCAPRGAVRTPVLFVHGAYVGAWCWEVHFMEHFARAGHPAYAVSLRGHGASEGRGQLHQTGIAQFVADLRRALAEVGEPPVLLGHSMGGLVVQKHLEESQAPAAVLMASVPPTGLLLSTFRMMTADPALMAQMLLLQGMGPSAVNLDVARRAVFSRQLEDAELQRHARRMQPESQRAIWEMAVGDLPRPWRVTETPMLVVGAEQDALFSVREMESTARQYGADLHLVPDMAHAMMLEPGWERAADPVIDWLRARGL